MIIRIHVIPFFSLSNTYIYFFFSWTHISMQFQKNFIFLQIFTIFAISLHLTNISKYVGIWRCNLTYWSLDCISFYTWFTRPSLHSFFPLALDFPLLWDPLLKPLPFSFLTRLPFLSNSWQSYFSWEIQKENSPHTIFLSLIRALFLLFFCDSSPLVFFWFSVCSSFAFLFWVAGEAAMKVIISISF